MIERTASSRSAGLLLYRRGGEGLEVLLGHPGGPFWRNKETGHRPNGRPLPLGEVKQPSGKTVHVWAVEGDWCPDHLKSNVFEMEWPPRSGRRQAFPELDRAAWFTIAEARERILKGQAVFLKRLVAAADQN